MIRLLLKLCFLSAPFALFFACVLFITPNITEVQQEKVQDKIERLILAASSTTQVIIAGLISKTAAPYPNVHFINFEAASTTAVLPNRYFSDYVHLNTDGARAFTTLFAQVGNLFGHLGN